MCVQTRFCKYCYSEVHPERMAMGMNYCTNDRCISRNKIGDSARVFAPYVPPVKTKAAKTSCRSRNVVVRTTSEVVTRTVKVMPEVNEVIPVGTPVVRRVVR